MSLTFYDVLFFYFFYLIDDRDEYSVHVFESYFSGVCGWVVVSFHDCVPLSVVSYFGDSVDDGVFGVWRVVADDVSDVDV